MKSTPARIAKTRRWWRASVNQKITGRNSEKDVRHIEIDLGDSDLRYQPGDALGVWYQNDPALVKELVELLWLKGDEPVTVEGKTLPLNEALQWHFELTVNTANIVENYATLTRSETLLPLVGDKAKLQHYAATTPIVDMVRFSPAQLDAEALINLLRPLTPRLYSIASSQAEVENEVHVTVGVVRYDVEGRARAGGASSFLADRVEEEGEVRVFIEHNDNFRLPTNPETPVIMIGPGTASRRSVPLCSSVPPTKRRVKTGYSLATHTLRKISSTRWNGSVTSKKAC